MMNEFILLVVFSWIRIGGVMITITDISLIRTYNQEHTHCLVYSLLLIS